MGGDAITLVLQLASAEAKASGHRDITPAHLLISLARLAEPEIGGAVAAGMSSAFGSLGVEPRQFRRRLRYLVRNAMPKGPGAPAHCQAILDTARGAAAQLDGELGPEQVLFAILGWLGASDRMPAPGTPEEARGDPIPDEL